MACWPSRRVWRGQPATQAPVDAVATGWAALDAVLPGGGWPAAALSEILLPADGVGELRLVWPALARLGQGDGASSRSSRRRIAPHAPAWQAAGFASRRAAGHRRQSARCVVGRRTMPAFGRVRGGVVLAAEGRRSRVATLAGGRRNRAHAGLRVPRRACGAESFARAAAHRDRNRAASPARAEVPRRAGAAVAARPSPQRRRWDEAAPCTGRAYCCRNWRWTASFADLRAPDAAAIALVEGPAQRRTLHSVTPAARMLGLRPGLSLARGAGAEHAFPGGRTRSRRRRTLSARCSRRGRIASARR